MTPPPHAPDQGPDTLSPSRRARAVVVFFGVWLIGTGIALAFSHHKHNPFDAFTTKVSRVGIPVVVGVYAALLAGAWAAGPRFRSEFVNEWIRNCVTIVGGVFGPHLLSFLFGLSP